MPLTFENHLETILSPQRPIRERMTMDVSIDRANGETDGWHAAVNECAVTAGPPFRMIELRIEFDGFEGPQTHRRRSDRRHADRLNGLQRLGRWPDRAP